VFTALAYDSDCTTMRVIQMLKPLEISPVNGAIAALDRGGRALFAA
jgi:hypothetical protein